MLKVGAHLSLGQKPHLVMQSAAEQGFTSLQIFASSPGAWKPPILPAARAADFREARRAIGLEPLFIHAIYLINLASDPFLVRRSRESLIATLEAGAYMGAATVVTHIGSHGGRGFQVVADQIADSLLAIVNTASGNVNLALEVSAGTGNIIGSELTELGDLIRRAQEHPRLKIALDTAHLCAAGWDFNDERNARQLVQQIDCAAGPARLVVIHANDSRVECGARRDRHANIGEGHIGLRGFQHLLAQQSLCRVPWILETPNINKRAEDLATLLDLNAQNTDNRQIVTQRLATEVAV